MLIEVVEVLLYLSTLYTFIHLIILVARQYWWIHSLNQEQICWNFTRKFLKPGRTLRDLLLLRIRTQRMSKNCIGVFDASVENAFFWDWSGITTRDVNDIFTTLLWDLFRFSSAFQNGDINIFQVLLIVVQLRLSLQKNIWLQRKGYDKLGLNNYDWSMFRILGHSVWEIMITIQLLNLCFNVGKCLPKFRVMIT